MSHSVREVLEVAAQSLRREGWCQGMERAKDGSGCVLGHLYRAAYSVTNDDTETYWHGAMTEARDLFAEANGIDLSYGIDTWNDDPARTYEDVALGFKRAIEHAES